MENHHSNERYFNQAHRPSYHHTRPERSRDTVLDAIHLQLERKQFTVSRRSNHIGQFLQITEKGSHKFNTIKVPVTGIQELLEAIRKVSEDSPQA